MNIPVKDALAPSLASGADTKNDVALSLGVPYAPQANKRVVVGMSGGVDSSVCVLRLQEQGYEVIGVTCLFVDDEASRAAIADAQSVARVLNVEHHVMDCTHAFSNNVVQPFIEQYACGLTPSPCVGCNKSCKIPSLVHMADELGCQYIATGHYARVVVCKGRRSIAVSHTMKDQSYMLALLGQDVLARLLLPLGDMTKDEVRSIAALAQLPIAHKADSQDICFIAGSHIDFLHDEGVVDAPGNFVTSDGRVVGQHHGLFQYTLGQRKGLGIGGAPEPYYVIDKRHDTNEVVVGFAREAFMDSAVISGVVWQALSLSERTALCEHTELCERGQALRVQVKLRYRQNAQDCTAYITDVSEAGDRVVVELDHPIDLTAPGQYGVLYDGDNVMGAGVITSVTHVHKRN